MAAALVRKKQQQIIRCEEEQVETARAADETSFEEATDFRQINSDARDYHAYEELDFEIDPESDEIAEVEAEFAAEHEAEDREEPDLSPEADVYPEDEEEAEVYPDDEEEAEVYPEDEEEAEVYPEDEEEAEVYPQDEEEAEVYPQDEEEAEVYPEDEEEAEVYPQDEEEAEVYPEDEEEAEVHREAAQRVPEDAQKATPPAAVRKWRRSKPAPANDCKRALMSELVSLLAKVGKPPQDQEDDDDLRRGRAMRRINRARLCHSGCEPLICKEAFCWAAETLAIQLADREAAHGLTEDLLADLSRCSALLKKKPADEDADMPPPLLLLEHGDEDEGSLVGMVISRVQFNDFDSLLEDSVNLWYQIGSSAALLAESADAEDQLSLCNHAQLLDCRSKRVGLAAVPVAADQPSGIAFVVAVFDNPVVNCPDLLASLPRRVESAIFD